MTNSTVVNENFGQAGPCSDMHGPAPVITEQDDLEGFAPSVDLPLDAGIRRAVLILRRAGVETFESCQGGDGHAFAEPTIKFHGNAWAGYKAFAVAMENGLPAARIQYVWHEVDTQLAGPWWEIVFSRVPNASLLTSGANLPRS